MLPSLQRVGCGGSAEWVLKLDVVESEAPPASEIQSPAPLPLMDDVTPTFRTPSWMGISRETKTDVACIIEACFVFCFVWSRERDISRTVQG